VTGAVRTGRTADEVVLRELQRALCNLLVMGVTVPAPARARMAIGYPSSNH
jgi:hypothetical protein